MTDDCGHLIPKHARTICEQAAEIGASNDLVGFPLLLVMRTVTFESLPTAGPYRRVEPFQIYEVAPPELAAIVDKRKEYLSGEIVSGAKDHNWSLQDWPQHLDNFIKFLEKSEVEEHYSEVLYRSFGTNRRAQMQILQLAYYDFLVESRQKTRGQAGDENETPAQYRIIEAMTKAGYRYPQKHYRYETDRRRIRQMLGESTAFDNRLIPSIFDYPYLNNYREKDFTYSGTELLATLRIMQLISFFDFRLASQREHQPLAVSEICIILSRLFGYDEGLVKWKIVELSEFDVAYIYGEYVEFDRDISKLRARALPKLDYMLEKYITDIAYLSLAVMRAPVGPFQEESVPFVDVASYEPGGDDLLNWIVVKFFNSVSAIRLLNDLNEIQEKEVQSGLARLPQHGRYREVATQFLSARPFGYVRKIRRDAVGHLAALIEGRITIAGKEFRPCEDGIFVTRHDEYLKLWG